MPCLRGQGLDGGFISRSTPAPAFLTPQPARYNIKLGDLTARVVGAMQFEYSDNINLSDKHPEWDLAFNPHAEVGFVYPIAESQLLELNIGIGYKWYLYHPSVSSIDIDPKTRIDYRIQVLHPVEIRFYDNFSITTDPTTRADVSGPEASLINFRLLNNTVGSLLNWQPTSQLRFAGGYSFGIVRSLTRNFEALDLNTHTFSAGAYYTISPRLTAGLNGTYSFLSYSTNFEASAQSYTIGPIVVFRPTEFISLNAGAGYTMMTFDQAPFRGGPSQSGGSLSLLISADHKINRFLSQDLNISNARSLGIDSNFNEEFIVQYGLSARFSAGITVRSSVTFDRLQSSGLFSENADRYLLYIGTSHQLTRLWKAAIGYTYVLKNSDVVDRGYSQNRVTLDISREF
jgi:hypothetical protein